MDIITDLLKVESAAHAGATCLCLVALEKDVGGIRLKEAAAQVGRSIMSFASAMKRVGPSTRRLRCFGNRSASMLIVEATANKASLTSTISFCV